MGRNLLSRTLPALKPILIAGILLVGVQPSQGALSLSLSQAQVQVAAWPGSRVFTPAHSVSDAVPSLAGHIDTIPTLPTEMPPSVFAAGRYYQAVVPSGVLSGAVPFSDEMAPVDFGGGEYRLPDVPDLADQQREEIQAEIDENVRRLGLQAPGTVTPFSTALSWPIRAAQSLTDYGYHGVSAFVDHNLANPDQLLDYTCGTRTYDIAGYNHQGTDLFTWPFGWSKMDNGEVEIIAAAPGAIVLRQDGNYDRSCAMSSNPWNGVIIQQADGSRTWYLHMKKNSVTPRPVGSTVVTGEYLGIVGSSGSSTGPHLHFEVRDAANHVIDPWAGTCNAISSWWSAQRPYYDSAVNALITGSAAPIFPSCPNAETSNAKDQFNPGDTVYFETYYRDQLLGQQSVYTVYQPDGAVYRSWTGASSASYYEASYWYRAYTLGASVPFGLWAFQVVFNGRTYLHYFTVGATVDLRGRPADGAAFLGWDVTGRLPANSTWRIAYAGLRGTHAPPAGRHRQSHPGIRPDWLDQLHLVHGHA
jgi:murein DD-endopeptidase MepM/ murein hydrolase activator NlpD